MKKYILLSIIAFSVSFTTLFAQKTIKLKIDHKLHEDPFAFNFTSANNNNVEFNVSRLEYYITGVTVIHDGGKETQALGFAYLVDASKSDTITLDDMDVTTIEGIKFYVGVDAERNHADPTKYASDHPLAPRSPAMHWGWSAGYRFVAMEGKSGANMSTKWEIHALGDNLYFPVGLTTGATDISGGKLITIKANYAKALQNIDVSSGPITHGDFSEAITLLQNFRNEVFKTTSGTGNTLSVEKTSVFSDFRLYPNPSTTGVFKIETGLKVTSEFSMQVVDLTGKVVIANTPINNSLTIDNPGVYFLKISNPSGLMETRKLVVQ